MQVPAPVKKKTMKKVQKGSDKDREISRESQVAQQRDHSEGTLERKKGGLIREISLKKQDATSIQWREVNVGEQRGFLKKKETLKIHWCHLKVQLLRESGRDLKKIYLERQENVGCPSHRGSSTSAFKWHASLQTPQFLPAPSLTVDQRQQRWRTWLLKQEAMVDQPSLHEEATFSWFRGQSLHQTCSGICKFLKGTPRYWTKELKLTSGFTNHNPSNLHPSTYSINHSSHHPSLLPIIYSTNH